MLSSSVNSLGENLNKHEYKKITKGPFQDYNILRLKLI